MASKSKSRARNYVCEYCHKKFSSSSNLYHHKTIHRPKTDFKCHFCKYTTNRRNQLTDHIRTHTKERPFKCTQPNCKASFISRASLYLHQRVHINKEDEDSQLLKCSKCPFKTVYKGGFNRHLLTHSAVKQFSCDLCPFQTKRKATLKEHHSALHLKLKPFKCPEPNCSYVGARKSDLNVHQLNRHMNQNEREKFLKFKCSECPYKTAIRQNFKGHLMTHSNEKPFSCHLCPYRAKQKSNIKTHNKQVHSIEKPFKCPQPNCNYSCKHRGSLKLHLNAHLGIKPWVCSFPGCDYKSTWKGHLKSHKMLHSEGKEKPFKCSFCPFTTLHSGSLTTHIRVHTGEAPFHCQNCSFRAKAASNFKNHLRACMLSKNNVGDSLKCKVAGCDFSTKQHSSMATHYNTIHNLPRVGLTKINL